MDITSTRSLGGHALWACFASSAMGQSKIAITESCTAFDGIINALGLKKIMDKDDNTYPLFNGIKDQIDWDQFHTYYAEKPFRVSPKSLPQQLQNSINLLKDKDLIVPNGIIGNKIAKNTEEDWHYTDHKTTDNTVMVANYSNFAGKGKNLKTVFTLSSGQEIFIDNNTDYTPLACIVANAKSLSGIVGTLHPIAIAAQIPTISVTDKKNQYWAERTPGGAVNCRFL